MGTLRDSTLIFRTVTRGDKIVGAIGVIGPCRMDYAKVVTTVDALSRNIQRMLSNGELPEGRVTSDQLTAHLSLIGSYEEGETE